MYINVHTHIFTLRTVLSGEAVNVMIQRLDDQGVPPMIVAAVRRFLERLLDRPEILDERAILARLLTELKRVSGFDQFLQANLARLPFAVVIEGEGLEQLPADTLRTAFDQLTSAMDGRSTLGKRPFDIVQTLRLALRTTITEVADELLNQMGRDDAIVALMMDIRAPEEPDRDRSNFIRQIAGTREAALQRPGRVLPFFAVHPERPDHFELMSEAIGSGAFLGVKLYPSLGYPVDSPALRRVYGYCIDHDVPVLLHCTHGGFYRKVEFIDYCDPSQWVPVLAGSLRELRVCFAHFGGWETLGRPHGLQPGTWGATILELMRTMPNVFTDLAYHCDQMRDPEDEAHYFRTLTSLLQDDHLRRRILFGSDSWLLRMDMTESVFWQYYRQKMSREDFERIANLAPREFLGFPTEAGGAMRANLDRHVQYLATNRDDFGSEPAGWFREVAGPAHTANREPADWSQWAPAVRCTYRICREYMTKAQVRGGYLANRTTRLNELSYYRPRDPNFGLLVDALAMNLVGCAEDLHAPYRDGWSRRDAVERLKRAAEDGGMRLVNVAGLIDSIFRFEEALV
jgi:predicted TIM-barrel fold metal-dependent hydrolase